MGNPGLKGRLLDSSVDAYILALETINRLSVKYRIETFTYLICNSWELLLKAKIIDDTKNRKAIYYARKPGEEPRTLSLRDCLKRVFANEKDPVRRNVERVADLRDQSVHFVIGHVPKDVLMLFQSCVLNYHKCLNTWFGLSVSDRVSVGMMTIVYDFRPEEFDFDSPMLRRRLGVETARYLVRLQQELREEFADLGRPAEFSIEMSYSLALVKKPGNADILLTSGAGGQTVGVVEVAKDPSLTHPYRRKEILEKIMLALPNSLKLNSFDIHCVIECHYIRKRSEFFYQGAIKGSPAQYSQEFVNWIWREYEKDPLFFDKAREAFKKTRITRKGSGSVTV